MDIRLWGLALLSILRAPSLAPAADWEATTAALVAREKPGYGAISGVLVDHATGDVYLYLSERGFYRSKDQGTNWEHLNAGPSRGRTEQPGCILLDPSGKTKRCVVATVYGGPIAVGTLDGGGWKTLDNASSHIDWCAVDWSKPDCKFVLALKHESGGTLLASQDGGKSFAEVGKGYGPGWVFGPTTAVVAEAKMREKPTPRLMRTTDGGKTFEPCGTYTATALPRQRGDEVFWLVDGALIRTHDAGKTWEKLGDLPNGRYGPIFGKDARQLFVLSRDGIVESLNGGATWSRPIALPAELKNVSPLSWIEYDPQGDVLFAMKMGSDLYRLKRRP